MNGTELFIKIMYTQMVCCACHGYNLLLLLVQTILNWWAVYLSCFSSWRVNLDPYTYMVGNISTLEMRYISKYF